MPTFRVARRWSRRLRAGEARRLALKDIPPRNADIPGSVRAFSYLRSEELTGRRSRRVAWIWVLVATGAAFAASMVGVFDLSTAIVLVPVVLLHLVAMRLSGYRNAVDCRRDLRSQLADGDPHCLTTIEARFADADAFESVRDVLAPIVAGYRGCAPWDSARTSAARREQRHARRTFAERAFRHLCSEGAGPVRAQRSVGFVPSLADQAWMD